MQNLAIYHSNAFVLSGIEFPSSWSKFELKAILWLT